MVMFGLPLRRVSFLLVLMACWIACGADGEAKEPQTFRVWAISCAHVPADIRRGRESIADVIRQSEGFVESRTRENEIALDQYLLFRLGASRPRPGDSCRRRTLPERIKMQF